MSRAIAVRTKIATNGPHGAPSGPQAALGGVAGSVPRVTGDPLAPLLELAGVTDGFAEARAAVDNALGHRALRRQGGQLAAEAALSAAAASAALEGSEFPIEEIRGGTVTDPVVQGALRVTEAVPRLVDQWRRAPLQVLARLHVLAARGLAPESELGRPSVAAPVPDLGHAVAAAPGPELGQAGAVGAGSERVAAELTARLDALAKLVAGGTSAPALLVAAVVHAELLAVRPFATGNGVVARAAARLTLTERGLDPRALIVPEVGHLARHPEYVGAAGAYATGTPDGVRSWLRHYATAVTLGAQETVTLATHLTP